MIRHLFVCAALVAVLVSGVRAADTTGEARVLAAESGISQNWFGRTVLRLGLSRGVPFRVFTLDSPARLVIDFRDLDWADVSPEDLLAENAGISALRFGPVQPGWTRLVADLTRPMLPEEIGMAVNRETGGALLELALAPAEPSDFTEKSGAPRDVLWTLDPQPLPPSVGTDGRFVVVIDPGHGGVDPGAERAGVSEKQLMLKVAKELREILLGMADMEVILTRDSDMFVSLQHRVALAHHVGADVFVSLHADALPEGGAQGATVYTLSKEASDAATEQLAARHNRTDLIAGADLTGSDDEVAGVLLDLARQETAPRALTLARALVSGMSGAGGPMNSHPLRKADFWVLKSADIPSVLVEIGFLSSKRDLENIRDPEWRRGIARAMAAAILDWKDADAGQRAQVRN